MKYYFLSQRKLHAIGNLASWMMLNDPPTSASLFWFYYSDANIKKKKTCKTWMRETHFIS